MSLFCKENDIPYPKYKILEEDLTSSEAQRQEDYWEKSYRNNGWTIFNISRTGSLGNFRKKWTKKALQEEADKYETRFEFQKNSNSAYSTAQRTGLLAELFKNHPNKGFLEIYWTEKRLQEEANKYKTRKEFRKMSKNGYSTAVNKHILDELFKNHPNNGYTKIKN